MQTHLAKGKVCYLGRKGKMPQFLPVSLDQSTQGQIDPFVVLSVDLLNQKSALAIPLANSKKRRAVCGVCVWGGVGG